MIDELSVGVFWDWRCIRGYGKMVMLREEVMDVDYLLNASKSRPYRQ